MEILHTEFMVLDLAQTPTDNERHSRLSLQYFHECSLHLKQARNVKRKMIDVSKHIYFDDLDCACPLQPIFNHFIMFSSSYDVWHHIVFHSSFGSVSYHMESKQCEVLAMHVKKKSTLNLLEISQHLQL